MLAVMLKGLECNQSRCRGTRLTSANTVVGAAAGRLADNFRIELTLPLHCQDEHMGHTPEVIACFIYIDVMTAVNPMRVA